jgi:hypothetical protein
MVYEDLQAAAEAEEEPIVPVSKCALLEDD